MSLAELGVRPLPVRGLRLLRARDVAWLGVGLALLLLLQGVLSSSQVYTGVTAVATAVALLGLGLVSGSGGMISLCQLSFAAIGAWVVAFLSLHGAPGSLVLWVLVGGIVTVPFGIVVGLPALRLRGLHLAIVTLAFATMVDAVFNNTGFPGTGSLVPVRRPSFLASDRAYFVFAGIWLLVIAVAVVAVSRGRLGASWRSLRSSERATAALGQSVPRLKLLAFGASAFLAGIAGGLIAGQIGVVSESSFVPSQSLVLFAVAVMIGSQYVEAAVIGGVMTVVIPQVLTTIGISNNWGTAAFGVGALFALKSGTSASEDARERRAERRARMPKDAPADLGLTPAGPVWRVRPPASPAGGGLEIEGLTVAYGSLVVLKDVSISVDPAIVTGLIGPNGAGKSTLVDVITGFVTPRSGSVRLDGLSLDDMSPNRRAQRGLRRTFQQDRVPRSLTVAEYLRLAAPKGRLDPDELASLLGLIGLPGEDRRIGTLDVGSCRLLEIAAGLAGRPKVLVLDEPAAGLGLAEKRHLAAALPAIPERFGTGVLLIEHDLELVRVACRRAVAIDFGQVIGEDEPERLLRSELVSKAYLGEALIG